MRLAWFTPFPPTRSGIADYSLEVLPGLAGEHVVDVFVASPDERRPGTPFPVRDAHDFPWRHHTAPYDLTVFQVGNAWCHDYMWPYVFRYPGLVVLHDAQLHHARAWSLLRRQRAGDYRAELAFNHPDLPSAAAEIALGGVAGPLYYFWPMLRATVTSARAVAVHNARLADDLRRQFPAAAIQAISMGVPAPVASDALVRALRSRHGLTPETVILAAFGGVTPEKRIGPILRAVARVRRTQPNLHLLLVGQPHDHYDAAAEAAAAGIGDIVSLVGYAEPDALAAYLRLADVALCLRWPSAGETSASWLRAIAAGRPTIVTDLAQVVDVPTLDPRSWTVLQCGGSRTSDPVAVSIDLLDEDHSLGLALERLCRDAGLRADLGAAAARHWAARHTIDVTVREYQSLLRVAAARPAPQIDLPRHLRPDASAHLRHLLDGFGPTALPRF